MLECSVVFGEGISIVLNEESTIDTNDFVNCNVSVSVNVESITGKLSVVGKLGPIRCTLESITCYLDSVSCKLFCNFDLSRIYNI